MKAFTLLLFFSLLVSYPLSIDGQCNDPDIVNQPVIFIGQEISSSAEYLEASCFSGCVGSECTFDAYVTAFFDFGGGDPPINQLRGIDFSNSYDVDFVSNLTGSDEWRGGTIKNGKMILSKSSELRFIDISNGSSTYFSTCASYTDIDEDQSSGDFYAVTSNTLYKVEIDWTDESDCTVVSTSCTEIGIIEGASCLSDISINSLGEAYVLDADLSILKQIDLTDGTTIGSDLNLDLTLNCAFYNNFQFNTDNTMIGMVSDPDFLFSAQPLVEVNSLTGSIDTLSTSTFCCGFSANSSFALCENSVAEQVHWYDSPTGGSLQGVGNLLDPTGTNAEEGPFDPEILGIYSYYAQCGTDPSCTRTKITISVVCPSVNIINEPVVMQGDLIDSSAYLSVVCEGACSNPADTPTVCGVSSYAYDYTDNSLIDGSNLDSIMPFESATYGGMILNGFWFGEKEDQIIATNIESGDIVELNTTIPNLLDIEMDPSTGKIYAVSLGPDNLYELNIEWSEESECGFPVSVSEELIGLLDPEAVANPLAIADLSILPSGQAYLFTPTIGTNGIDPNLIFKLNLENANTYNPVELGTSYYSTTSCFTSNPDDESKIYGYIADIYTFAFVSINPELGTLSIESSTPQNTHINAFAYCEANTVFPVIPPVKWYDKAISGSLQYLGNQFNPTGTLAEEGLFDINIAGTYTYYVQCGPEETCERTPVTITVTPEANGCTVVDNNNAESGWSVWIDGGADAALSNKAEFANSGTHSFLIKDDTPTSEIRTNLFDLSGYDELVVDFNFITIGFDNENEDFYLELSLDGGTTFNQIEEWNLTDEFENNVRVFENLTISGPFSSNTVLRFICDASGNNDKVYIDDIIIEGCNACEDCFSCEEMDFNNAESGWGIWIDGGADAALSNKAEFANSGTHSFLIKDDTPTSEIRSLTLNLSALDQIIFDFNFIAHGFDNANEDFFLEISLDGGTTFNQVEEWNLTDEFENDIRVFENLTVSGPFTSNTVFRFICDASGNNDKLYIDDISIEGCNAIAGIIDESSTRHSDEQKDLVVYPNPVFSGGDVVLELPYGITAVSFFSMSGEMVFSKEVFSQSHLTVSTSNLNAGTYIIKAKSHTKHYTLKMIIIR